MTIREINALFKKKLAIKFTAQEVTALLHEYFEMKWHIPKYALYLESDKEFCSSELQEMEADLHRLLRQEPLQYVLGKTLFYGRMFHVNPLVLIPRPETEELVDMIVCDHGHRDSLAVLDVGTGSGVIAISLQRALPQSRVFALDYSDAILDVVRLNARECAANVEILCCDILSVDSERLPKVDLIVSNPPYIPYSEQSKLSPNIIEYEPHEALFAPDADPLLFYRKITQLGAHCLNAGGWLYFETHENFHDALKILLQETLYCNIRSLQDINGRNRFIVAQKL